MKKQTLLIAVCMVLTGCHGSDWKARHSVAYSGGNPALVDVASDRKGEAHFPSHIDGGKAFIFDPKATAWAAYDASGNRVETGRASGGQGYCTDIKRGCRTTAGVFRVYHKKGADCKSSKFPLGRGGAPMPHCMFFNGGYAIHGSYDVPDHNASHGCIRVTPSAAQWLSNNFMSVGTKVIVRSY